MCAATVTGLIFYNSGPTSGRNWKKLVSSRRNWKKIEEPREKNRKPKDFDILSELIYMSEVPSFNMGLPFLFVDSGVTDG